MKIHEKIEAMTPEQKEALIQKAMMAGLDEACRIIQNAIGQTDGGVAGHFFSGDLHTAEFTDELTAYMSHEASMSRLYEEES